MSNNAVYYSKAGGDGVPCTIMAETGTNATILRPIAQVVQRLEEARKNAGFTHALRDLYVDGVIAIEFLPDYKLAFFFQTVNVNLSFGRPPNLVVEARGSEKSHLTIQFTPTVYADWSRPREGAGCLDCAGEYTCPSCASFQTPFVARAAQTVVSQ